MNSVSGSAFSSMSGAQVALRLLSQPASTSPPSQSQATAPAAVSADVASLLEHATKARALRQNLPSADAYDPASDLPEDWSMGAMVSIDTLEPTYREYAQGLGATHVRFYGADPVSDAVFMDMASAFLEETYATDPAYQAAKAAGLVTIRRTSDILIELGDRSAGAQHMAFFRGPNGSEYFGSGSTGIPSDAFQGWWAQENAAGHYLAVAGTKGYQFVASWASA